MASRGSNASLLAGAAAYAINCVSHVTPGVLSCPTPCAGWDLATLLRHVNDSLTAVHEGIAAGHIRPRSADPGTGDQGMNLVATFCDLASGLLQAVPPLVPPAARNTLFAAPLPVPPQASRSDQLIAWLGRNPRHANI